MIDFVFGEPVANLLREIGAVHAKTTIDHGFKGNAADDVIIKSIADDGYLLLTHDRNTIDEYRYPPCTHAGIIIIRDKRWSQEKVFERVRALCLSGHKKLTSHAVTYLYEEGATFHTHDGLVIHEWE